MQTTQVQDEVGCISVCGVQDGCAGDGPMQSMQDMLVWEVTGVRPASVEGGECGVVSNVMGVCMCMMQNEPGTK
jgi:hypothetical protein